MRRYLDPDGLVHGLPTYPYRYAPDGLYTRSQLREMGLRPIADPVAQVMWDGSARHRRSGEPVRTAALYDITQTLLRDTPSLTRLAQLAIARACRRICPACDRMWPYVIPAAAGMCLDCQTLTAAGVPVGSSTDVFDPTAGRAAA
ncbi:hypothetical protein FF36_05973 [Frankia torreyi]|uniref:Uncharacterized protein n=1 Tax=Frankia torreyi TaxID=1856 RepID=Q9AF08_9ACTN|nr:RRQRL motif-containing zinc-binding protein [Frankia torreyi]AAK20146.1 hypothetical protein [Frankia torreyi]KJE19718.1 hypothetical protein FF36_05973 [Frankia torreyi]